tara:strand:- start:568 stop:951 length:384 start_codon:yes stop_codon:yes gene_type:complete
MKKYSNKSLAKRKEERKCLPDFFSRHIEIAKNTRCEECGDKLVGNASEIAHVLPKGFFKSIMCNDLNVLYLCGLYSKNNCHFKLDNASIKEVKEMAVYPKIQNIFQELELQIEEKINYKHYELYGLN